MCSVSWCEIRLIFKHVMFSECHAGPFSQGAALEAQRHSISQHQSVQGMADTQQLTGILFPFLRSPNIIRKRQHETHLKYQV